MAAANYFDTVQKIYIAFYQRPADPAGLTYWASRIDVAGGDASAVIAEFANSPEATALYGPINSTTIGNVIDALYMALFNRAPDAAGKQFYIDEFNAGRKGAGTIALDVLAGARDDDAVAIANKLTVANDFTEQVDGRDMADPLFGTGTSFDATYAGDADAAAARDILKAVTSNPATVLNPSQVADAIKSDIADAGDPILNQSSGQTFTLTANVDNIQGTSGDDTVIAGPGSAGGVHTLGASDVINGGAGTDKIIITSQAGLLGENLVPRMTSVEQVFVQAVGAGTTTVNMINTTGAQELWNDNSTANVRITNLQEKATIGVRGGNGANNYTVEAAAAARIGDLAVALDGADVLNVTVNDGTAARAGYASTTIDATGNSVIRGNLDAGAALNKVTITGEGSVRVVGNLEATVRTIDASANKGGVNFNIANNTGNVTFTGGDGNDRINFGNTLNLQDKVDGGAGRDILAVNSQAQIQPGLQVSNVEVLELNTLNGTLNAALIAGVDEVRVTNTLTNGVVNGLTSNSTFVTNAAGTATLNLVNAQVAGTNDTLNLKTGLTANGSVNVMAGGVENIAYTDNVTANTGRVTTVNFFDTDGVIDVTNLTLAGNAGNTVNFNGLVNTIRTVDGSASMGSTNVSIAAGNPTNGVTIKGGAQASILRGGDGKDIIVGGAGNDVIQGDASAGTAQVTRLSSFGTVDIGDTYSFTINGQTVSYTATAATQANVVAGLAAAVNGNAIISGSGVSASVSGGNLVLTGNANGMAFTVANVASTNAAPTAQTSSYDFGTVAFDAGDSIAASIGGQPITTGALAAATSAVGAAAAFANAVNANAALAAAGITAVITGSKVVVTGNASGAAFPAGNPTVTNAAATADVETVTFASSAAGDVYTVTVQGVQLTPIVSDATVANDATTLANLINTNGALTAAGVTATHAAGVTTITDAQGNDLGVSIVKAGAGTATPGSTTTGIVVTNNSVGNPVTVNGHGAGATGQTLPTVTQTTDPVLGGTPNSDTLTGDGGNDLFVFVGQTGGWNGAALTNMDTITDLNLGGASGATSVDTIQLSSAVLGYGAFGASSLVNAGGAVAITGPSFSAALQGLFNAGGALAGATNNVGLFTYGADTYLIAANGAAGLDANDIVIKVTGVTGTLDLSDLVIV
ncbi:hypothetical protein C6568_04775 [Melaminivora suipulveris]|uniref:DUF4214 domain-containing protein n=1 Tax=Melaminivora suipulveris TaxID=2109913 RepID=A0A2R3QAG1_9BURK|nr:hypothetical protein [Melaminivora suipulveris]AVO48654.1 hypothetical protein C6568_04775 [Melaminivora suipulveris]